MNQEMLETLIGKFIDSEITPAEQRLLDEELMNNPQGRLLLQQFQQMHEQTRQLVSQGILPVGDSPETIFSRARWAEERASGSNKIFPGKWGNQAASVAAALLVVLLGYAAYLGRTHQSDISPATNHTDAITGNTEISDNKTAVAVAGTTDDPSTEPPRKLLQTYPSGFSYLPDVIVYSDPSGSQWLLEVVPEKASQVQNVAYQGDI